MISWGVIIRCGPIGNIPNFAKFLAPFTERTQICAARNAVIIQPEKIERAPSGTGVSARMAVLHAKGQMQFGDKLIGRSIIDWRFEGKIFGAMTVSRLESIQPTVSGQG